MHRIHNARDFLEPLFFTGTKLPESRSVWSIDHAAQVTFAGIDPG